jgi:hypothetical protein
MCGSSVNLHGSGYAPCRKPCRQIPLRVLLLSDVHANSTHVGYPNEESSESVARAPVADSTQHALDIHLPSACILIIPIPCAFLYGIVQKLREVVITKKGRARLCEWGEESVESSQSVFKRGYMQLPYGAPHDIGPVIAHGKGPRDLGALFNDG